MYIHLGGEAVVKREDILGFFDLDNTSFSRITREFLRRAEQNGQLIPISEELPKSFVLCAQKKGESRVFFSQLNSATLIKRAENITYE